MEPLEFSSLLTIYGPLGIGWVVAGYLLLRLLALIEKYHSVMVEYTKAITQLTTIVEERLK